VSRLAKAAIAAVSPVLAQNSLTLISPANRQNRSIVKQSRVQIIVAFLLVAIEGRPQSCYFN
jgi:hypothetical protein